MRIFNVAMATITEHARKFIAGETSFDFGVIVRVKRIYGKIVSVYVAVDDKKIGIQNVNNSTLESMIKKVLRLTAKELATN